MHPRRRLMPASYRVPPNADGMLNEQMQRIQANCRLSEQHAAKAGSKRIVRGGDSTQAPPP